MAKPEYEFHQPAAVWAPAAGAVAGVWKQMLAYDPDSGSYTGLTRYDAGVDTSADGPACHEYWEEVYILEGELTDLTLGRTFRQGMYACRPPGMVHGPWRTATGVLMLAVCYVSVQ
jgi:hypothetical protein